MTKRTALLIVCVLAEVGVCGGQTARDHFVLGDRHYIRSQRMSNNLPVGVEYGAPLSATDSGCSMTLMHRDQFSIRYAVLSEWSPYGELRSEVWLADNEAINVVGATCLRLEDSVVTLWHQLDAESCWLRTFDYFGVPATASLQIATGFEQGEGGIHVLETAYGGGNLFVTLN